MEKSTNWNAISKFCQLVFESIKTSISIIQKQFKKCIQDSKW